MARINIDGLLKHMDFEFKRALAQSLIKNLPDIEVDKNQVYSAFAKALNLECQTWHKIPDSLLDID